MFVTYSWMLMLSVKVKILPFPKDGVDFSMQLFFVICCDMHIFIVVIIATHFTTNSRRIIIAIIIATG